MTRSDGIALKVLFMIFSILMKACFLATVSILSFILKSLAFSSVLIWFNVPSSDFLYFFVRFPWDVFLLLFVKLTYISCFYLRETLLRAFILYIFLNYIVYSGNRHALSETSTIFNKSSSKHSVRLYMKRVFSRFCNGLLVVSFGSIYKCRQLS